jgi:hypothetical protein
MSSDDGQEADQIAQDDGWGRLPEGWEQLPTGLPAARLYRIAPPDGSVAEWQAEMTLDGEVRSQRCTSKLRARAWLAVSGKPRFTLVFFDQEELHQP